MSGFALLLSIALIWVGVHLGESSLLLLAFVPTLYLLAYYKFRAIKIARIVYQTETLADFNADPEALSFALRFRKHNAFRSNEVGRVVEVSSEAVSAESKLEEASYEGDVASALRTLAEKLTGEFDARACALGFCADSQPQVIEVYGQNANLLQNELNFSLSPFFERGQNLNFGFSDQAINGGLFGNFLPLGLRYTVVYPIPTRLGKCVLWVGYGENSNISEQVLAFIKLRTSTIARDLDSEVLYGELQQRAKIAEANDSEKSEYLAHLSHDMRSPLHNVKSILNLLRLEDRTGKNESLFDAAIMNCDSLSEIVDDVLDLTRHRAGQLCAEIKMFDLSQLLRALHSSYQLDAEARGLQLDLECENQLFVAADPKQLRRILANLISNAIKYTKYGRVFVKAARKKDDRLAISVSDTGIGMSSEQLSKLFTPFTRFSDECVEGIGLGLMLSKVLVALNKGNLEVNSIPGSGSVFTVFLPSPSSGCQLAPGANKAINEGYLKSGDVPTVLVVDDDRDCVETLARVLESFGFKTLTAVSEHDALSIVNFAKPDLIISDAQMPEGGIETLALSLKGLGKSTPIIVLTGDYSKEKLAKYQALGAWDTIEKPADPQYLLERVRAAIESRNFERASDLAKIA